MKRRIFGLLLATATTAAFGFGCATYSRVGENHGRAHRETLSRQTANPSAAQENLEPVLGIEGGTGEQVMENYRRDQADPGTATLPSIINLGIGTE